ncbi:hypothetical protein HU200_037385 [Digitaria exilis]|uniref:Peroxidase 1 n=1 Tax=Digitaria exilis TaxID=1010633 RepID=A0A835EK36_9POAL|nr:hypothetical protein HU200_037385 [Digitaria exilis]
MATIFCRRTAVVAMLLICLTMCTGPAAGQLAVGYYSKTCPAAEDIVRNETAAAISASPDLAAALLRLHYHDCFVQGCDASVLLDSTPTNTAEKDSKPNGSLRGFDVVARVKDRLEHACPGTVSCADILALMARDAVFLAKGPTWAVALGRRDGRVSSAGNCGELPPLHGDIDLMVQSFAAKGLDVKDLVEEIDREQLRKAMVMAAASPPLLLVVLLLTTTAMMTAEAHVEIGAYNKTCPQAEDIVLKEMTAILARSPDLAGPVLRLLSVDCFVGGCEGSILLDSTANNTSEKDSPLNQGVGGYEIVDAIKAKLEAACPGVVSCADTLALAARDSIRLSKGPFIPLPTGRRDGNRSVAADVALNSPPPGATMADIIALFANKFNLTAKDVAVLSGAHTIGKARCSTVSPRLYNFGGKKGASDPTLDANYTATLRGECKPGDNATLVDLDPPTPTVFDTDYYALVAGKRGLLSTDAALLLDPATSAYVAAQANATSSDEFFSDFAKSFVAMSKLGVLTHQKGEIRQLCSKVNTPTTHNAAAARTTQQTAVAGMALALAVALVL